MGFKGVFAAVRPVDAYYPGNMSEMPDERLKKRRIRDMTLAEWVELTICVLVSAIALMAGVNWLSGSA